MPAGPAGQPANAPPGAGHVTLVLGGARSGKSAYAERLALESGLAPVYLATGQAGDGEMAARIAQHRAHRGAAWMTVEEPLELSVALARAAGPRHFVVVDCLTLWVSNLMAAGREVEPASRDLAAALPRLAGPVALVANEVGLGVVPDNALARAFRDHAGRLNQAVAAAAHRVAFIAAGLPLILKDAKDAA